MQSGAVQLGSKNKVLPLPSDQATVPKMRASFRRPAFFRAREDATGREKNFKADGFIVRDGTELVLV